MLCSITASVLLGELKDAPGKDPSGGRAVLEEPEGSCGTRSVKQEGSGCYTSTEKAFAGCDSFILSTVTVTSKFREGTTCLLGNSNLLVVLRQAREG